MMAGIRGQNTQPEIRIRKALHARGFRYRLHVAGLPGRPDIVLPRYRSVILVHGCFWHGHDCPLFRLPATRTDFWQAKISRNRERDEEVLAKLAAHDWRCLTVWECAFRGPGQRGFEQVVDMAEEWLTVGEVKSEIRGRDISAVSSSS